ncbi:helix-turn-helix domain-containing protein [Marinilactibacillus psychrotolerans]|uniref:helix-turn-helix domain-containing protein n=1 Tax=Marinilactibacillus psychrotolerans TaxID=191770 RepID=UPI0038861B42
MGFRERLELLIEEKKREKGRFTVSQLEQDLNLSKGSVSKWKKSMPKADTLGQIADYFNVSIDFLLGRTDKRNYWELTSTDEQDVQLQLERLIDDLAHADAIAFSKGEEPMSEETKQLLIISLENSLRVGKKMAKKKFTPKKHRGNAE